MYQNRNRWISVPKDQQAQHDLDYCSASDDQLIQICIKQGNTLSRLYKNEIFELINNTAGSMIDDYEEEEITDPVKIKSVIEVLINKEKNCSQEILPLVVSIRKLFAEALHRGTGVYFFF